MRCKTLYEIVKNERDDKSCLVYKCIVYVQTNCMQNTEHISTLEVFDSIFPLRTLFTKQTILNNDKKGRNDINKAKTVID